LWLARVIERCLASLWHAPVSGACQVITPGDHAGRRRSLLSRPSGKHRPVQSRQSVNAQCDVTIF